MDPEWNFREPFPALPSPGPHGDTSDPGHAGGGRAGRARRVRIRTGARAAFPPGPRGAPGEGVRVLGEQHASRVRGRFLLPLVSCKKFLSYIYFFQFFLIAQNTKTGRLDSVCHLKLCLLPELLFPLGGKSPDTALPPLLPAHGLFRLFAVSSFEFARIQSTPSPTPPPCVENPGRRLGKRPRILCPPPVPFS